VNRQIIGLTGLMGSGKSLAAQELERIGFTRTRFAGSLKDMMRVLGLTEEEIEGSLKETACALLGGKTPRYAMQTIGTEWGRELIDPELWVNVWKHKVSTIAPRVSVSVEDVRFPNEAEAVRSLGGIVVRITRGVTKAGSGHASEAMDFQADYHVENDGTIEQFQQKIRDLAMYRFGHNHAA
jgi:hypothetical protein